MGFGGKHPCWSVPSVDWQKSLLPSSHGGMNLRYAFVHAPTAFIGYHLLTVLKLILGFWQDPSPHIDLALISLSTSALISLSTSALISLSTSALISLSTSDHQPDWHQPELCQCTSIHVDTFLSTRAHTLTNSTSLTHAEDLADVSLATTKLRLSW